MRRGKTLLMLSEEDKAKGERRSEIRLTRSELF